MYKEGGYVQIVEYCAKESMAAASQEVKALQPYARNGEVWCCCFCCVYCLALLCTCHLFHQWVITDAHHDSTSNAFHSTVPCLSGRLESLDEPVLLSISPVRDNITYRVAPKLDINSFCSTICADLKSKRKTYPKSVIFVRTYSDCCTYTLQLERLWGK